MCSCSEHGIVTGAYRYPVQRQVTTSLVGASVRLWRIDDLARMSPSELYLTSKRHQSLPFCAHLSCKNFLSIWVGLPVRLAAPAIFHQLELFSKPLELQTSPCNCLVPELDLQLSNFVFKKNRVVVSGGNSHPPPWLILASGCVLGVGPGTGWGVVQTATLFVLACFTHAAFVSTHSLPLWERYLRVPLTIPSSFSSRFQGNQLAAGTEEGALKLLQPVSAWAFPATPGHEGRRGEGLVPQQPERRVMSLAPNAGIIQISTVGAAQLSLCPVNPLRASVNTQHKDTDKCGIRARTQKCFTHFQ